jgi:hypothetical protein
MIIGGRLSTSRLGVKVGYPVIALLATVVLVTLASVVASCSQMPTTVRLNMKSYGNHDELSYSSTLGNVTYDERILTIRPEYVIDNPAHGLYGEMGNPKYTALLGCFRGP